MSGARGAICIVRHSFYPWELNVKREAEALRDEGYAVHVICLRDEGESPSEEVDGVSVHRMPVGHERGRILRYLFEYNAFFVLAKLALLRLHFRHRFRAIQVNTMPDALVFVALIPRLFGARVVLHMHEPVPELFATMFDGWYRGFFVAVTRFAERISLAFADRVLTVTREMRDNFGDRGADVNKITVIVNVPDDRLFRVEDYAEVRERVALMKREERRRGVFRVLTHGAVEQRYGQDLIVRAVARLASEIPGIQFRFMGKGSYTNDVLALARELGVEERVHYLGWVSFEAMVEEILSADVTVVPQRSNAYSNLVHTNKMYEYVALERPVVASRLRSTLAYFGEDSLVFYDPESDEDLARALYHVFAHPDEVEDRVRAATAIYETHRWSRERRKYLGVYESLLGATPSPDPTARS
jgi:glycosyltransferase involved in cell wall biosynthesis